MTATAGAVTTDTTVVKALRRIRMPQTQRNRELGLLLFAFLINGAAVALVQAFRPAERAAPRWLKVVVDLFVSVQLGHLQHPEFVLLHGVVAVRLP